MNKDQKKRNLILGFDSPDYPGGIEPFRHISLDTLEELVKENFINLEDRFNDSPSAEEFLEFMRKYPHVTAHGYAIDISRPDYGISIEGLESRGSTSEKFKRDWVCEFRLADEFVYEEEYLYCWWD